MINCSSSCYYESDILAREKYITCQQDENLPATVDDIIRVGLLNIIIPTLTIKLNLILETLNQQTILAIHKS